MCLDASNNKSYPTDLPVKNGLALWLDAADDTTFSYSSGTSVSQWRDKSGNNRHFFQATAGNQPSRSAVINSRKAIQFTAASSQYLRYNSTIINNTTGGSVFVAWRTAGETGAYSSILDNYHCGSNALGAGFQIERNVTNNQYYWGFNTPGCGNGGFIPATSYSNDTTNCIWITKDSTTITGGLNGTSTTPVSSPSATWIEDDKGWTIGAWGGGTESFGRFFNGINCEVIIFNRGLSPTEVKQINTYLGQKWGISNTDRSIVDLAGNDDNGLFGNGTVANMPDYSYYNKGTFKFNGSTDYINCGNTNTLNFGSGDFSVEMWFTRDTNATTNLRLLSKAAESNLSSSAGFAFFGADSGISFAVNPSGTRSIISAASYSVGEWVHVVGVVERSSTMRAYKNAVLTDSATAPAGSVSNASVDLNIGRAAESNSLYWAGNIAIVRIYNKALTVAEITQNYEAQKSKFANTIVQQGLVLNLDAGNIYSYAGAGTTWYDVSGNSFNATLINSPTYTSDNGGVLNWASANSQYATVPMSSTLRVATITQEAWVYLSTTADQVFIGSQYGTSYNNSFGLWVESGAFAFGVNTGGNLYYSTTSTVSTGVWYHLTHTYNATTQLFYINGVLAATYNSAASGNISYDTSNTLLAIGADFNGTGYNVGPSVYTNGKMPVVRIYNIALSAAQVLQNYNATKGRFGLL